AGVPDSCGESTDEAPHTNCRSPVQVFLWSIPGRVAEEGPPGWVKADFVSANANSRWDVYIDDQVVCTTPWSKWVNPDRPVLMRARDDGLPFMGPDKITMTNLTAEGPVAGALQLQAHPTSRGELVTGITFTSFGGLGVMTGIALAASGCGGSSSDPCTRGLVALGGGAPLTPRAVLLILGSMPRAPTPGGSRGWGAPPRENPPPTATGVWF